MILWILWNDGVPAVTQCPIAPGDSFTYSFIADTYGSSWYHSHYSAQYADGVFGPIVIHGPTASDYDLDIGPVLVTDYYHLNYTTINERAFSSNFSVVTVPGVNSLINGRNNYNCSLVDEGDTSPCVSNAGVSTFQFTAGKKHRLRFVNAGASALQTISIDGHNLTVIANDFVPVVPYQTQYIKLGVGQRTDVIVEGLPDATGSYFLRSQSPAKPCADTIQPNATAIIYYRNEYLPEPDPWPAFTDAVQVCANDPLETTVPLYPIASPSNPATTWDLNITLAQNETGSYLWYMNNITFRGDYNHPILLLSNLGNNSYPNPEWNVENFGSNSSIRMVVNNANPRTHPMHLHGHNYLVEAVGNGTWDGIITRPDNPQRRDTQLVPGNGYMVISFTADNPGAWPFHCHVAWHVAAGLYVTVLERPDDIANYKIPSTVAQTCRNWWAYTNATVVDQIDSGL
ncbi:uncharacterized protein BHQ10_002047 [Talaromyces amestolkiae]|uniref:Multicopper oxidase n=1 Tax=Talaromyces amestolkiae TaxID=1196081 RepID=A0A364KR64_TALAM|nr:uncharacterized protein BHQ10_002047 [Talaromyces amestolkiae]RAO66035.1 hypothetical protein BHQ10_002047 [Talaromyces amestolkiae]